MCVCVCVWGGGGGISHCSSKKPLTLAGAAVFEAGPNSIRLQTPVVLFQFPADGLD